MTTAWMMGRADDLLSMCRQIFEDIAECRDLRPRELRLLLAVASMHAYASLKGLPALLAALSEGSAWTGAAQDPPPMDKVVSFRVNGTRRFLIYAALFEAMHRCGIRPALAVWCRFHYHNHMVRVRASSPPLPSSSTPLLSSPLNKHRIRWPSWMSLIKSSYLATSPEPCMCSVTTRRGGVKSCMFSQHITFETDGLPLPLPPPLPLALAYCCAKVRRGWSHSFAKISAHWRDCRGGDDWRSASCRQTASDRPQTARPLGGAGRE